MIKMTTAGFMLENKNPTFKEEVESSTHMNLIFIMTNSILIDLLGKRNCDYAAVIIGNIKLELIKSNH